MKTLIALMLMTGVAYGSWIPVSSVPGDFNVDGDLTVGGGAAIGGNVTITSVATGSTSIPLDVQASNAAGANDRVFRVGRSGDIEEFYISGDGRVWADSSIISRSYLGVSTTTPKMVLTDTTSGEADWTAQVDADDMTFTPDADAPFGANTVLTLGGDGTATFHGALSVSDLMCEQVMSDYTAQTIPIGADAITNWVANITDAGYTRSTSNITVLAAGRYTISNWLAFETDNASQVECYLYTNEVEVSIGGVSTVGWDRTQSAVNSDGVTSASATLTLAANTRVSWYVETPAEEDFIWNHGTFRVERK